MKNLFSALHKYYQRENCSPEENQITEMLAQVLAWKPEFTRFLFRKWFPQLPELVQPRIETQLVATIGEGESTITKFVDLAVFDDSDQGRELAFVVEIKWWSGTNWSQDELGENVPQTINYDSFIERYWPKRAEVGRLYLTRKIDQPTSGWVARRWSDVHIDASKFLRMDSGTQTFGSILLGQFLLFLEEQNVDEKPLTIHDAAHLKVGADMYQKMERLFTRAFAELQSKYQLPVGGKAWKGMLGGNIARYGIYGVSLSLGANRAIWWGIFPREAFEAVDPGSLIPEGFPIVSVVVDAKPQSPERKRFLESKCMKSLEENFRWTVVKHQDRWAVIHCSLPLTEIPYSANTGTDNLSERVAYFFVSKTGELVEAGIRNFLESAQATADSSLDK